MTSALRAALALFVASAAALPQDQTPHSVLAQIDKYMEELTRITGLKAREKVEFAVLSREKVNAFLKSRVTEVASPEEIRREELALKKFGLVPDDFDLAKSTVDIFTEQAVALYDYHRKKLYLTDWTPSETQEPALVHELAHALADQNFRLDRYLKKANENDDGSLARMAVMEGQATWLMTEYTARKMGQSLKGAGPVVEAMSRMANTPAGQFPVFEQAPLYMRETLLFPYTKGMLFQQAVVDKLGERAFSEVFLRAPVSTQQILHPEKYFSKEAPSLPALPEFRAKGYKRIIDGTVGELDHAILLTQYVSQGEAMTLAPKWRGGRYAVYETRDRASAVLAYASAWESAAAAGEYFRNYREVLKKKWKSMEISAESAGEIRGNGDGGGFVLKLEGSGITSLEGLPLNY
jgi:hypothetical protein